MANKYTYTGDAGAKGRQATAAMLNELCAMNLGLENVHIDSKRDALMAEIMGVIGGAGVSLDALILNLDIPAGGTVVIGTDPLPEDGSGAVLRVGGGVILGGPLVTVASVVGASGLNVPAGTAPTAPVDGDIWTTATKMYVRIGGVTKEIAFV